MSYRTYPPFLLLKLILNQHSLGRLFFFLPA